MSCPRIVLSFTICFVCCRPLLKLVDRLLLVGMLRNEDIMKLLIMIHPETWDPTFEKGTKVVGS